MGDEKFIYVKRLGGDGYEEQMERRRGKKDHQQNTTPDLVRKYIVDGKFGPAFMFYSNWLQMRIKYNFDTFV